MEKIFRRETITLAAALLLLGFASAVCLILEFYGLGALPRALTYICSLYIIGKDISPVYKLSFCLPMLLFPSVGGALWLTAGGAKAVKRLSMRGKKPEKAEGQGSAVSRYLAGCGFPVFGSIGTEYYPWGDALLKALLEKLRAARSSVYMEFFIVSGGKALDAVLSVLYEKAAAGVDVRLIIDAAGSAYTKPARFVRELREHGVKLREFNVPRFYDIAGANLRDHRKIAVIDGDYAFCGGINLADEYFGMKERFGVWKDGGFGTGGEAARVFERMFLSMWENCPRTGERAAKCVCAVVPAGGEPVQPFADDPADGRRISLNVYLSLISSARRRLWITSPYLACDDEIIGAVCRAAASGVDVRFVFPGIPDKKYVNIITKSRYRRLIEAGAAVFEYEKGFVHSKNLISDDIAVCGTINLDYRSFASHYECGCLFFGRQTVDKVSRDFSELLLDCRRVASSEQGAIKRAVSALLELIAPMM